MSDTIKSAAVKSKEFALSDEEFVGVDRQLGDLYAKICTERYIVAAQREGQPEVIPGNANKHERIIDNTVLRVTITPAPGYNKGTVQAMSFIFEQATQGNKCQRTGTVEAAVRIERKKGNVILTHSRTINAAEGMAYNENVRIYKTAYEGGIRQIENAEEIARTEAAWRARRAAEINLDALRL